MNDRGSVNDRTRALSREIFDTSTEVDVTGRDDDEIRRKDMEYIKRMNSFQEKHILSRVALFMSPIQILGILGCFFPWVYAFVPVHASEMCLCSFYNLSSANNLSGNGY